MGYMSVKQAAEAWNISERFVQRYCIQGRVEGAMKARGSWQIPADAKKPDDPRRNVAKSVVLPEKKKAEEKVSLPSERSRTEATAPLPEKSRTEATAPLSEKNRTEVTAPLSGKSKMEATAPLSERSRTEATAPLSVKNSARVMLSPAKKNPFPYIASTHIAMPLLNSSFHPGLCEEAIVRMEDADERAMALAEYYFFSGQAEKASDLTASYLKHEDLALKLSACWVFAYANLALDRIPAAHYALQLLHTATAAVDERASERDRALATCISTGASTLLHLPQSKNEKPRRQYISKLQPGLRLFVLYVEAHYAYLGGHYGVGVGIAETALALESDPYPIPTIYLHLAAAMNYMNLRRTDEAKEHVLEAWKIAQPDHLIEPFAEHHGLLGGLLEVTLKKACPEEFRQMIQITYRFSAGWRKIHNPETGENVADNLTTTEFAIAMLAARGWTNQEIAAHMGISEHTVRHHLSIVFQKLDITQRKELVKFMLK